MPSQRSNVVRRGTDVDTPLGLRVTDVYRRHPECFDAEMQKTLATDPDGDALAFDGLTYIQSAEESRSLNDLQSPRSSSRLPACAKADGSSTT